MVERVGPIFVAVTVPPDVAAALFDRLGSLDIPGKIAPPENWHITLRYLGRVEEVVYDRFLHAIDGAYVGAPFRVGLGGLGAFPRPKKATVVWIAVSKGSERLGELAAISEEAAQTAGLAAEERPFRPHLTLSRVRPPVDVTALTSGPPPLAVDWRCTSITVCRSVPGPGGVSYQPLDSFRLSR
ncbi:MAG TPA: RNA 2',3'-cyclic phosphodiesterase [Acidimicrobiia bacterium]